MLLFEHMMQSVRPVSARPVPRPSPVGGLHVGSWAASRGSAIEITWPGPGAGTSVPKVDLSGIIKAMAAIAVAAAAAGLVQANRQENEEARRAADKAGLNRQGRDALHREISKKGYSQQEIEDIAKELYDNFPKYRK
jgi:hypothetical protein